MASSSSSTWSSYKELLHVVNSAVFARSEEIYHDLEPLLRRHKPAFLTLAERPVRMTFFLKVDLFSWLLYRCCIQYLRPLVADLHLAFVDLYQYPQFSCSLVCMYVYCMCSVYRSTCLQNHSLPARYSPTKYLPSTNLPCTYQVPTYPVPTKYSPTLYLPSTHLPCTYQVLTYPVPTKYSPTLYLQCMATYYTKCSIFVFMVEYPSQDLMTMKLHVQCIYVHDIVCWYCVEQLVTRRLQLTMSSLSHSKRTLLTEMR